jgi:hypothetical protein
MATIAQTIPKRRRSPVTLPLATPRSAHQLTTRTPRGVRSTAHADPVRVGDRAGVDVGAAHHRRVQSYIAIGTIGC